MIGRALAAYPPSSDATSTSATGTVLLMVEPGYYLSSSNASQLFQLGASTSSASASDVQAAAATAEAALPMGSQIAQGMGVGTLVVRDATFTHSVVVLGTTSFRGPVVFGETNAGTVHVDPGQYVIDVLFPEPYPLPPHVFASPEIQDLSGGLGYDHTIWDGGYYLTNVTTTGFEIRLPRGGYCPTVSVTPCPISLSFNWFVVGFEGGATTSTAPTTQEPVTTATTTEATASGSAVLETTPTQETAGSPTSTTEVVPTPTATDAPSTTEAPASVSAETPAPEPALAPAPEPPPSTDTPPATVTEIPPAPPADSSTGTPVTTAP